MKYTLLPLLCLLTAILFCGCTRRGTPVSEPTSSEDMSPADTDPGREITLSFVNEVEETDVWILPDTPENRKLSLWGTATMGDVKKDENRRVSLRVPADADRFLLHMITPDQMYFGVSDLPLETGCTLRFYKETDPYLVWYVEVLDADGTSQGSFEVFGAAL
ncbi:MAG: hypothetical protein K6A77_11795 [Clostridiales bacterium]|nr:hypothetical protein [Clostridiales bacterium]